MEHSQLLQRTRVQLLASIWRLVPDYNYTSRSSDLCGCQTSTRCIHIHVSNILNAHKTVSINLKKLLFFPPSYLKYFPSSLFLGNPLIRNCIKLTSCLHPNTSIYTQSLHPSLVTLNELGVVYRPDVTLRLNSLGHGR